MRSSFDRRLRKLEARGSGRYDAVHRVIVNVGESTEVALERDGIVLGDNDLLFIRRLIEPAIRET